jgi:hypothetical protein
MYLSLMLIAKGYSKSTIDAILVIFSLSAVPLSLSAVKIEADDWLLCVDNKTPRS